MSEAKAPHPLHGNQMRAVDPADTVWLSASAGTGKTQVLASRVLRLLLQPEVEPSQILCLTFTKAGAAEMAERINTTLARWVRLGAGPLARELEAIGADIGPAAQERARTLFAKVLDCPGGGLRIDTIHAFAQWLLAAFPHEAGLPPGARAMEEGRERSLLYRQVLAEVLNEAAAPLGDPALLEAAAELGLRMQPGEVEKFLLRCAAAQGLWTGPGSWQEPMRPHVHRLLGLPADASQVDAVALCADEAFDIEALRCCLSAYEQWDGVKGRAGRAVLAGWLWAEPSARLASLDGLWKTLFTQQDTVKDVKSLTRFEESFEQAAIQVMESAQRVKELRTLLALAARLLPALRLGRAFSLAWAAAKEREGLIDFDDQIRLAAGLLTNSDQAQWIGYKLDRHFDHILVDEAQDTNAAQWEIILDGLTQEFFSGLGQRGDRLRTLFVVGDYKQAIFRFQGTSPENFEAARRRVSEAMIGAKVNTLRQRGGGNARDLREYGLERSFRSARPVLEFIDRAIAHIGHTNFGLGKAPDEHLGEALPGHVAIWRSIGDPAGAREEGDEGDEGWLSKPQRQLAERIARQVRQWLDKGLYLEKHKRRAGPGDVMVLVRKRADLAALIVARLHAAGVPVAGVDRLRLAAPLAVRDLVAALRFAAQPFDDLTLAALLVSPLIGWTQEQLLEHGYRDKRVRLWDHLRRSPHAEVAGAMDQLGDLLARADMQPPQDLLHWLLTGPWQGRRKLVARLGGEANDPIDELLNAAHAYAAGATPSLAGFLAWFDASDDEVKREPAAAGEQVRVRTVHGAKGLQAPIVILADAAGEPGRGRGQPLDLPDPAAPEKRSVPLPSLRKDERVGEIAAIHAAGELAERQEHWRLLYVAMTRAEEALFIGGALGSGKKEAPAESWYEQLSGMFDPDAWAEDDLWVGRLEWGDALRFEPREAQAAEPPLPEVAPPWLMRQPPAEPRPPKPLAPSALGEDLTADPPWPPGASSGAARRGVLIHKLLERLPELPAEARDEAASRWLARNAPELGDTVRAELASSALTVIETEAWRELFSPDALAEVPIAARVGERMVAGTIDRLLVEPDRIRLVDFKTARRPPETLAQVPAGLIRQMAAYGAALEAAYPGRTVEAALLYTAAPLLIAIPADVLEAHKQALLGAE